MPSQTEKSNADVFDELEKGDRIQFDGKASTKNPHVVTTEEPSGGFRAVEGPGGAEKTLIQNKHNPDYISIMSMGNRRDHGARVENLRIVG